MTTDPSLPEQKKRRFTVLDGVVFTLALAALASPFVARIKSQASPAVPQVAVRGEVSAVRPIDIAMGYNEQRAEAAFFEGLGEPVSLETDAALDLALAGPVDDEIAVIDEPVSEPSAASEPLALTEDDPEFDFAEDITLSRPDAAPEIDDAVEAEETDLPSEETEVAEIETDVEIESEIEEASEDENAEFEIAELDEPDPVVTVRVIMSAPPTMTPIPNASPRRSELAEVEVASLETSASDLPVTVTPRVEITDSVIEESPLPPLNAEAAARRVALSTPEVVVSDEIVDLPSDVIPVVTPPAPAPIVVAQAAPKPARPAAPAPARPPAKVTNGPRIALVIAAAGLNTNVTRFAIEALPEGITLAFAPIKPEAGALAKEAKADGHTILVEIPMEPVNRSRDPGPMTLRVADTPEENLDRLNQALSRISVADGASSYLGARFNADVRAATPVLRALSERGLFFFENEPTSRSVFQRVAASSDLRYARGVVKIDRDRGAASIRRALDDLEKQARQRGYAVGVGTALRGTISTVALWSKEAEKRGVRLVPITAVGR